MSTSKILLSLSLVALAGCSSIIETPSQKIEIVTPGAKISWCDLHIGNMIYRAEPPQILTIKKTDHPIEVKCLASGNRMKTTVVEPRLSRYAAGNVVTAGIGVAYDYASGALFNYPERIIVDFTQEIASPSPLPSYHDTDSQIVGYKGIEPMGADRLETPTSVERANREEWIEEKGRRQESVMYGHKEKTSPSSGENIPDLVSPF